MAGISPIALNAVNPIEDISGLDVKQKAAPVAFSEFSRAPFQVILEEAVESLQNISNVEFRTNDLIKKYAEKKVPIEDVMLSVNELSLAVSLASTVVTTGVQSFKEIQQMPI